MVNGGITFPDAKRIKTFKNKAPQTSPKLNSDLFGHGYCRTSMTEDSIMS